MSVRLNALIFLAEINKRTGSAAELVDSKVNFMFHPGPEFAPVNDDLPLRT
jgi:hypothetical protein